MHHLFCTFLPLLNSKKEPSVPQPSIFSNEMRIAQISLNTDTAVWVIQLLPWWPEDLAFPSTAAHATLNTLHSPGAFPPSDMRVKQTSEMSAPKHWSRFCVIPRPFLYQHLHRVTLILHTKDFPTTVSVFVSCTQHLTYFN